MKGYGGNGSDYEKTVPGDTEESRKAKQSTDPRESMKNTSMLIGNRRMRRDKKEGRSMER